jgi:hypothetical protein
MMDPPSLQDTHAAECVHGDSVDTDAATRVQVTRAILVEKKKLSRIR